MLLTPQHTVEEAIRSIEDRASDAAILRRLDVAGRCRSRAGVLLRARRQALEKFKRWPTPSGVRSTLTHSVRKSDRKSTGTGSVQEGATMPRTSRAKRIARAAREREILARFDFKNRPALMAARARRAASRATKRRKVSNA